MGWFFLQASGWLFVVLAAGTAVVLGMGSRLPEREAETATVTVAAPQARVWGMVTKPAEMRRWRGEMGEVSAREGLPCWTERLGWMAVPMCVVAEDAPREVTVAIVDGRLPVQGRWRYALGADGPGSTRVRVEQETVTGPAMWRFYRRYVGGKEATAAGLADKLARAGAEQ